MLIMQACCAVFVLLLVTYSAAFSFDTCQNTCSCDHFYCQKTKTCVASRNDRCTNDSDACYGKDDYCYNGNPAWYDVYVGHVKLSLSSSLSRSSSNYELKHLFLSYRGFTYEQGKRYGYAELDMNDPLYRYRPSGGEKVTKYVAVGSSQCLRSDIVKFVENYKATHGEYKLVGNNCQHFANKLKKYLLSNCGRRAAAEANDEEYRRYVVSAATKCNQSDCSDSCRMNENLVVGQDGDWVCGCEDDSLTSTGGSHYAAYTTMQVAASLITWKIYKLLF